jgi:hypothetical protein
MTEVKSWKTVYSPIDKERLCSYLKQPLEGMSEDNLVKLWNSYTDLSLPRIDGKNKPLINLITGEQHEMA